MFYAILKYIPRRFRWYSRKLPAMFATGGQVSSSVTQSRLVLTPKKRKGRRNEQCCYAAAAGKTCQQSMADRDRRHAGDIHGGARYFHRIGGVAAHCGKPFG